MAREHNQKVSGAPFKLSWPAVFGGLFAATGVWLLLHALGLALGLSRMDLDATNLSRAASIGTSVWAIVTSFIAMFVGGLVTARSAGYLGRGNGAIHGIVLWGATAFVGTLALSWVLGSVAGSLASAGTQAGSAALQQSGAVANALGLDADRVLAQANERLTQAGKPPITEEQLYAATQDAVVSAVRQGQFDRELFVGAIADNTELTEAEVREVFSTTTQRLEQEFAAMRNRLTQSAERVATITGRVFWGLFALLITSLVGSVLGASTGVSRRQRELVVASPTIPLGSRPGEAYP
jgi:hypothetical protein